MPTRGDECDLVEPASVAPEVLEARLAKLRVSRGMRDGNVAEPACLSLQACHSLRSTNSYGKRDGAWLLQRITAHNMRRLPLGTMDNRGVWQSSFHTATDRESDRSLADLPLWVHFALSAERQPRRPMLRGLLHIVLQPISGIALSGGSPRAVRSIFSAITLARAPEVDPMLWTTGSGFLSGTAAVRSSQ